MDILILFKYCKRYLERIIAKVHYDRRIRADTDTYDQLHPDDRTQNCKYTFRIKIADLINGCFCPCVPLFCSFIKTPPLC